MQSRALRLYRQLLDSEGSSPFRPARSGCKRILECRVLRAAKVAEKEGVPGESLSGRPLLTPRTPNTSQEGPTVRILLPPAASRVRT